MVSEPGHLPDSSGIPAPGIAGMLCIISKVLVQGYIIQVGNMWEKCTVFECFPYGKGCGYNLTGFFSICGFKSTFKQPPRAQKGFKKHPTILPWEKNGKTSC